MPRRGRRGGRNNNAQSIMRIVNQRIRALALNSAPTWHLTRGNRFDPPIYVEDVLYQRKVRVAFAVPAGGSFTTPPSILAAAGLPVGSFAFLTILRIDMWGEAGVNNGIRLNTNILVDNGSIADREFDDFGVQGSRRPHIGVMISPKDQQFVGTDSSALIAGYSVLSPIGEPIAGSVIVDFLVQFKNTVTVVRERRREVQRSLTNGYYDYDGEDYPESNYPQEEEEIPWNTDPRVDAHARSHLRHAIESTAESSEDNPNSRPFQESVTAGTTTTDILVADVRGMSPMRDVLYAPSDT